MTTEEQKAFDDQKAKIEELATKVAEAVAEMEKQKAIALNAEAKFKEMGAETGENRKAVADAGKLMIETKAAQDKAVEDLGKVQVELAELKKQGPNGEGEKSGDEKRTADELEADLTEDEVKVLDKAFEGADESIKLKIKSDPKIRKQFILQAKEAAESEAASDLSTWRNKPAQKKADPSSDGDAIEKLFTQNKDRARFVPNGPRGGSPRPGKVRPQGGDDSKLRPKNKF